MGGPGGYRRFYGRKFCFTATRVHSNALFNIYSSKTAFFAPNVSLSAT